MRITLCRVESPVKVPGLRCVKVPGLRWQPSARRSRNPGIVGPTWSRCVDIGTEPRARACSWSMFFRRQVERGEQVPGASLPHVNEAVGRDAIAVEGPQ